MLFNSIQSILSGFAQIASAERQEKFEAEKEALNNETQAKLEALQKQKDNNQISDDEYKKRRKKILDHEKLHTKRLESESKKTIRN